MSAKTSESKAQAIIDLYKSGAQYTLITALLNVSKPTVLRVLREADIPLRNLSRQDRQRISKDILAAFRRGLGIEEIARELAVSSRVVRSVTREANIAPDVPDGAVPIPEPWAEGYYVTRDGAVYRAQPGKPLIRLRSLLNPHTGHTSLSMRRNTRYLGEIMLTAFVRPRPDGLVVHHKNGQRDDNRLENLEWVTRSESLTAFH